MQEFSTFRYLGTLEAAGTKWFNAKTVASVASVFRIRSLTPHAESEWAEVSFDGSVSTIADIVEADGSSDTGTVKGGVDLGAPHGVGFFRVYPRSGLTGRGDGHYLYGSNAAALDDWKRIGIME